MGQRYFIELSFDGTRFHGWQKQDNAVSVQEVLTDAFQSILRKEIKITGCGRTDTGVHAKEFFAHFDFDDTIPDLKKTVYKINSVLPEDIAVHRIFPVRQDLHARFSAIKRTYQYVINSRRDPFQRHFEYYFTQDLDIDLMNNTCKILMNYEDFSCFTKSNTQVNNYHCAIYEAEWQAVNSRKIFTITANRFLRNMVRAIAGTMLDIGLRKMTLEEFRELLEKGTRSDAGTSLPAHGLSLVKVYYPGDIDDC